ncbi:MAG: neutral/alkaline non-lysosomal ceramidase N-terminal domain-containing protein [Bacteroidia bacterium]|nr:neutral/alkaline non-lysosomal ceramidase N-terminal domain-containing protein [Bacteroidia bacterium]
MSSYWIGAAKQDITAEVAGIGMIGWGVFGNTVKDVQSRLFARAFVIKDSQTSRKVALVTCDLAFITTGVRQYVLKKIAAYSEKLGITDQNLLLMANHTHSAPGGYSHYPLYNLTVSGYSPEVFNKIVNGIFDAIVQADANQKPGKIYFDTAEFSANDPVAFNRSIDAYNLNPDVIKYDFNHRHLATDREMQLLRFDTEDDKPIGCLNWFAIHTTTVHNDKHSISSDNKGCASELFEQWQTGGEQGRNEGFISAFANGAAGDVTPNFKKHFGDKLWRGESRDDFENLKQHGKLQFEKAKQIWQSSSQKAPLSVRVDALQAYVDFTNIEVDAAYTDKTGCKTGTAHIGSEFTAGTKEGPGTNRLIVSTFEVIEKIRQKISPTLDRNIQGNKISIIDCANHSSLGIQNFHKIPLLSKIDPYIRALARCSANDSFGSQPLTPNILPIQLVVLGEIAIIAAPAEFTTVAGKRLKNTVQGILSNENIQKVIFAGYANAYAGYVATFEEYQLQRYEGASTHFGQYTLAAYQTMFAWLATEAILNRFERSHFTTVKPYEFSDAELEKRMYDPKNPY